MTRGSLAARAVAIGAFIASACASMPALASGYASYEVKYRFGSFIDTTATLIFDEPVGETGTIGTAEGNASMHYGTDIPAGFSYIIDQPYFFNDIPLNTPVASTVYGLTDDLTGPTSYGGLAGGDLSSVHLVLALDRSFAMSIEGMDFRDAFSDFPDFVAASHDYYLSGIYPDLLDEGNFIYELLSAAGRAEDYGLEQSPYGGTPTNLLFDFGDYLQTRGGSLIAGGQFNLVAFSTATIVGDGSVESISLATPAVPEPASWALMLLGTFLAGAALRRAGRQRASLRAAF